MVYHNAEFQWISYFFIYSIFGWIFESSYVSLKQGKWINRGFLKGPFLPIYGSGAVMMLVVSEPFADNLILTYFAGVVGATLLELASGIALEAIFKVRYWDYSYQKINYKGYICLSSSAAWGFFTIGLTGWLHPFVLYCLGRVPGQAGDFIFAIIFILFDVDLIVSVREAVDMRDLLIYMENARHEMQLMKKRADVIMAVVDNEWQEIKTASPAVLRIGELKSSLEAQLERMKEKVPHLMGLSDLQKRELAELMEKYTAFKNNHYKIVENNFLNMRKRILGNPGMVSRRYPVSLESLKHKILEEKE